MVMALRRRWILQSGSVYTMSSIVARLMQSNKRQELEKIIHHRIPFHYIHV